MQPCIGAKGKLLWFDLFMLLFHHRPPVSSWRTEDRSNMEMQIENSGDSEDKLHLGPPRPRRHRRHRRKLGHVKARTIEDLQDEHPGGI